MKILFRPADVDAVGWENVAKFPESIEPIKVDHPVWREWQDAQWDEMLGITPRHKFVRALMKPLSTEELNSIPVGVGW